ncbi:hypothetical protein M0804_003244 [Polistes exclamans]|nr:hypothetical protein M0804_003244 [Polistes exclamans]
MLVNPDEERKARSQWLSWSFCAMDTPSEPVAGAVSHQIVTNASYKESLLPDRTLEMSEKEEQEKDAKKEQSSKGFPNDLDLETVVERQIKTGSVSFSLG